MPPLLSQCFNDPFDVAQELPGMGRWAKGQVNQERDEFFLEVGPNGTVVPLAMRGRCPWLC